MDHSKITRVEVIDEDGRSYVNYAVSELILSLQDDGKTLKIFLKQSGPKDQISQEQIDSLKSLLRRPARPIYAEIVDLTIFKEGEK